MTRVYRPKKSTLMILSGVLLVAALIALSCSSGARLIIGLMASSVGCALWGCATEARCK